MTNLDAALSRLGELAEEATSGPWHKTGDQMPDVCTDSFVLAQCKRTNDAAFLAAADPLVVKALVRVARAADDLSGYYPCEMDDGPVCLERGAEIPCPSCRTRAALDYLASLLTEEARDA